MRSLFIVAAALLASSAHACFLTGEEVSGLNKICLYSCPGGMKAITVRAVALCPLSLNREQDRPMFSRRLEYVAE